MMKFTTSSSGFSTRLLPSALPIILLWICPFLSHQTAFAFQQSNGLGEFNQIQSSSLVKNPLADSAAVGVGAGRGAISTHSTPLSATGSYLDSLTLDKANESPTTTYNSDVHSSPPPPSIPSSSPKSTKPTTKRRQTIQTLNSVSDFLSYLDDSPRDSLCVVEFYGKNCPLCKKVALKYKKIANQFASKGDGVQFAQMEHPANKPIMDVLGIQQFPFLHVYRNGQCVAAHGTESDKQFEYIVKDTIQRELDMTPEDWNHFLSAFEGPISQGTAKIEQLRLSM